MLLIEVGDEALVQNVRHRFPRILAGRETQPFNQKLGLSIVKALFKQLLHLMNVANNGTRSNGIRQGSASVVACCRGGLGLLCPGMGSSQRSGLGTRLFGSRGLNTALFRLHINFCWTVGARYWVGVSGRKLSGGKSASVK